MYCLLALVMLVRGFADAIMMRMQQAFAFHSGGFLVPEHYDQIFSAHGTIMIFFVAMPFVIGLMNFVVPLQLGVRDVAFPTLNSVSFWLTASGVLLINLSLFIGEFSQAGWMGYPPLSELAFSPGVGVDYYLWALQISGVGTLLTGVNFVTTILKLRAPGMTYMRMPIFCWTALASNLLIVAAFPVLTATFVMLLLDRYLGFHFFTTDMGGNAMMYVNLFWAWGHPEVYILILPAFGVFSEVVSTFSGKPVFGYRSMVMATLAICVLSFMVWLHHFFTMGAGADVNAVFGIMSMIIAIPTGVKIFNWLFTMWGGRVRFEPPMLWAIAFMVTFVLGGMTGVLLAVPPADFVLHNSLFLVAHFHNVIIGGVLFGAFAGYNYWFPKAFGFRLEKRFGTAAFWFWVVGFYVAFMPLYVVGLEGMTRRMQHYDVAEWRPWLIVAAGGAVLILCGILCQILQIAVSIRERDALARPHRRPVGRADARMDHRLAAAGLQFRRPARTSRGRRPIGASSSGRSRWRSSRRCRATKRSRCRSTAPTGFVVAFFAVVTGFALIWHIWWMAAVGVAGAFATFVVFAWRDHDEYEVPAEEVARIDAQRREARVDLVEGREPGIRLVKVVGEGRAGPRGPCRAVRWRPRAEAHRHRLRLLGVPAQRLRDVLRLLCGLRGAVALDRGRSGAARTVQPEDRRVRDGLPSPVELRLRPRDRSPPTSRTCCGPRSASSLTGLLGLGFLGLEVNEFARMIAEGNGPDRSAFLSAFFALVGCHGLHVTIGLLWLGTMMAQFFTKGFRPGIMRRGLCFALFWHALDIIWVGIFTNVYLLGTLQ